MADMEHIEEDPRRQRQARRQALDTMRDYKCGKVRPLAHINDASCIFGAINSIAGILAVEAESEGGLADTVMAHALEGIAILAALGSFAQEARA